MSAIAHCQHIGAGNTKVRITPWEEETKVPCFTLSLTLPYCLLPGKFFVSIFLNAAIPWIYTKTKSYFIKIRAPQCSLLLQGFPESACNAGDLGSIHGLERSPEEGDGNPLQYSCLLFSTGTIPMDRGAWQVTNHGVAKSRT